MQDRVVRDVTRSAGKKVRYPMFVILLDRRIDKVFTELPESRHIRVCRVQNRFLSVVFDDLWSVSGVEDLKLWFGRPHVEFVSKNKQT